MKASFPLILIAMGLISACSETATMEPQPMPQPQPQPQGFEPQAASFTANDVSRFMDDASEIANFEDSGIDNDNNGSATYNGGFLIEDMTVNGRSGFGMIGDSEITIDFNSNGVDGRISDVNFTENGTPTELLNGALSIQQGEYDSDEFEASGVIAGTLTGGFGQNQSGSVRFDMPMDAELLMQEDSTTGDEDYGLSGVVTGGGTGSTTIQVIRGTVHGLD